MKQSDFSSDRIIGISDGVFAVAMTLLVLDGLALGGMAVAYRRQTKSAGGAIEESSVARPVAIIVAGALSSCLLALVQPRLGVLIWVVYPFASAVGGRARHPEHSRAGDGS